jgi:hypothetical protein
MIRTHSISSEEACLMAVTALDELVNQIVRASDYQTSASFFDWIADEATTLVELNVAQSFNNGKFAHSLRAVDPRIALARWVGQWVAPKIAMKFAHLAPHLPVFSMASVADAQPVAHEHVKAFWHDWRPIQLLALPPWGVSLVAYAAQVGHR